MGSERAVPPRESAPALSIGSVLGDSDAESTAWRRAINELGKSVVAKRDGVESALRVNVVFHVDGRLVPNDFTGVRTGRFTSKEAHLMVQAAVPLGPAEDRRAVLLQLLEASIQEAELFAQNRGIAECLPALRNLLVQVSSHSSL